MEFLFLLIQFRDNQGLRAVFSQLLLFCFLLAALSGIKIEAAWGDVLEFELWEITFLTAMKTALFLLLTDDSAGCSLTCARKSPEQW